MNHIKEVTLEMSLKPFKSKERSYIEQTCHDLFNQWKPLIKNADVVCIMLWTADGSELLDYTGDLNQKFEWAKYIGRANEFDGDWNEESDPKKLSPHATRYLYMDNPPQFTYRDLQLIISSLKKIGKMVCKKRIKVGTTFDPGPEFAVSEFKYQRHPEICTAGTMGDKSFAVSYENLHADNFPYKTYPHGIEEGTPFATFLGKQTNAFLKDMGFDYIWMSNGFGFGAENWATTGPLFDGNQFNDDIGIVQDVKDKTLRFWKLFRDECHEYEVQTRGTNLSVGIDFATDAVATKKIYDGQFNIVPPPNSPWAALDKNFGLELSGYMSRIAQLPEKMGYMYRFYLHDPWWMNSPWFDRYEGEPHDIYLPLAISRVSKQMKIETSSYLNLLSIDNSLGNMPDDAVNTTMPHLLKAYRNLPDKASPFVWVYPFEEYQSIDKEANTYQLKKAFFEDWFITSAINGGLPLSTVVDTNIFAENTENNIDFYQGSVLIVPTPYQNTPFETAIISYIESGGQVVMYGSLTHVSEKILKLLHLKLVDGLDGKLKMTNQLLGEFKDECLSEYIDHNEQISDGKIDTVLLNDDEDIEVLSTLSDGEHERVSAICKGNVVWLRGSNSNVVKEGSNLLVAHNSNEYFNAELQLRHVLKKFDYHISFHKKDSNSNLPALTIHRHDNAFIFSGYLPDTTVDVKMHFPLGVPIFISHETYIQNGYGNYNFARSFNLECRVFVEQRQSGVISMYEYGPVSVIMKRRIMLEGLKDATIYVFPEEGKEKKCELLLNSTKPNSIGQPFVYELVDTKWGKAYKAEHITGHIMCSYEFDDVNYLERKENE